MKPALAVSPIVPLLVVSLVGCISPSEQRRRDAVLTQARTEAVDIKDLSFPTGKGPGEYLQMADATKVYHVVFGGEAGKSGWSKWIIKPENRKSVLHWKGVDRVVRGQMLFADSRTFDFHDGPGVDAKFDHPDPSWRETRRTGVRFWLDDDSRGAKILLYFSDELQ